MLAAPKTVSEIARLTREAYEKHRGACMAVELLPVDRRGFLGAVFSAGALVLGANLLTDQRDGRHRLAAQRLPRL